MQNEKGAQQVEDIFYEAQAQNETVLLNIINLGEIFYRCARVKDIDFARTVLEKIDLLPIKILSCPNELVMAAAEIKARFPLAYADAFAVATAIRHDARIVTGDPEFAQVSDLVEIDWLSRE